MIGDRVKKIRVEKKMSITELAEKAGVAKSYLSSFQPLHVGLTHNLMVIG